MMRKFPTTRIKNHSEKVDKYLNLIYEMKDEIDGIEFKYLVELLDDIEGWRVCLDEIELSVKSQHIYNTLDKSVDYNDDSKEITIY